MKQYGNPENLRSAPDQVLYEKDARRHIAWITLNRPDKHNAMSVPMRARLADLIHEAERDNDVRVIVIRGNGKSFCSGNEINEDWGQRVPGQKRMTLTAANRYATDMNYGRQGFSQAISRCSKVTILRLHGYCAAAAYFMIATRTDLVVVSADAKIGALEARFLGPAGAVSATHINRIIGTKAARRALYRASVFRRGRLPARHGAPVRAGGAPGKHSQRAGGTDCQPAARTAAVLQGASARSGSAARHQRAGNYRAAVFALSSGRKR